ncbi:Dol-P-Man:Man(7)GlcNAc(2)-PP-Dol alpha-1,6-mannosyltransferase [Leucoagaricus gongylophorus]
MRSLTSLALDTSFFLIGWSYVIVAPYTKVEESFNIQAIHDLLTHGFTPDKLKNFDHFLFSGPIPRTFLGSTLLTCIAYPFINIAAYLNLISSKADLQIIVRLALATINAVALVCFRKAVSNRFGHTTASFFALLTCSQFHLPFWMGRTLPNMFALPLVNIALSYLLDKIDLTRIPDRSWKYALWLLGFSCIIFRVELLLLWIPITLQLLVQGQASFCSLLATNLAAAATASAISFFVDSYFWQRKLLPELSSFVFNAMYGKSSNWGVSPWQTYFTVHLPRLLMTGFPVAYIGLLSDPRISFFLLPHIAFIFLISNLGHKEWRFIIYSVPAFNVVAARGFKYLPSLPAPRGTRKPCLAVMPFPPSMSSFLQQYLVSYVISRVPHILMVCTSSSSRSYLQPCCSIRSNPFPTLIRSASPHLLSVVPECPSVAPLDVQQDRETFPCRHLVNITFYTHYI